MMNEEISEAGSQHYWFTFAITPGLLQSDPLAVFAQLMDEDRQQFMDAAWQWAGEHARAEGQSASDRFEGGVEIVRWGWEPLVLIQMPEPRLIPEAYYLLIHFRLDLRRLPQVPETPEWNYITLEKTRSLGPEATTMLCRVLDDGGHVNFGFGPPPNKDAFLEAAIGVLDNIVADPCGT